MAGTFVLWLVLALSLSFLMYLIIAQSDKTLPDDDLSRREAILEDKLNRLLTPLLAAGEFEVLVSLAESIPGSKTALDSVVTGLSAESSPEVTGAKVVILLDASRDHGEIEPVIRDLVLSALVVRESDLRIVRQVFRHPTSYLEWLPPLPLLNMMIAASLAVAAALALVGARAVSPKPHVAHAEDVRLDFQGLHSLSKDEPRRVANVLSQWISQDDA